MQTIDPLPQNPLDPTSEPDTPHVVFYLDKDRKHYFVGFTKEPKLTKFSVQINRAYRFSSEYDAAQFAWKYRKMREDLQIEKIFEEEK